MEQRGIAAKRTILVHTGGNGNISDTATRQAEPGPRNIQLGVGPHVQSGVILTIHVRNGKRLLASPVETEDDGATRALVRSMAARTKGAHAWVTRQGLSPRETMEPELWRQTMEDPWV